MTVPFDEGLSRRKGKGRGESAAPLALPHRIVQPFAPVAGLALGVGDGIDDDVIVKFFKDDAEGKDAQTNRIRCTSTSVCERPPRRQPT